MSDASIRPLKHHTGLLKRKKSNRISNTELSPRDSYKAVAHLPTERPEWIKRQLEEAGAVKAQVGWRGWPGQIRLADSDLNRASL